MTGEELHADNARNDDGSEPSPATIEFLAFEDICRIHDRALAEFGQGLAGFLDEHTVRSAAAQAEAGVSGKYFHEFPAGMAAAYLYYLTNQQGFVNGNKRTAVGATIAFLTRNGYRLNATSYEIYQLTVRVAGEDVKGDRKLILAEITKWIEERLVRME